MVTLAHISLATVGVGETLHVCGYPCAVVFRVHYQEIITRNDEVGIMQLHVSSMNNQVHRRVRLTLPALIMCLVIQIARLKAIIEQMSSTETQAPFPQQATAQAFPDQG